LRIGKKLFNRTHPDYIPFVITNEILGGYFGSRLMKNIREDKGYTYGIYSSIGSLKNEGYWVIAADVKKEFAENAIAEIFKEINKIIEQPVETEELERVKKYMLGSFMNQLNTPFDLMDRFKAIHYTGLDYSYYDRFIETVKTISSETIQKIAQTHFTPNNLVIVKVG
jgi:zinc protease